MHWYVTVAGISTFQKQVISMKQGRCVVMHTTVNSRPAVVLLGASTSQARTNDATNLMNWVSNLPKRI